jgi:23S rRNA (cytosine1962-C5)-methyltransferase
MSQVVLKEGREKSVLLRHPWVFSGAVVRVEGDPRQGDVVDVLDAGGTFLARGYFNRASQIVVRLLTWTRDEEVDAAFWRRRLMASIARRDPPDPAGAQRLVHAESDGLPGLIVDRYGPWLVMQSLTAGIDRWKPTVVGSLAELLSPLGIYERSDVDVRGQEGLRPSSGVLLGEAPPERVEIVEDGLRFAVDIRRGHKTGFYLDQRDNRARLAPYCAGGEVLNAFSYTGAFGVYAARRGAARITNLDTSADALRACAAHLALNGLPEQLAENVEGDAFHVLRTWRDQGRLFDVIILDPPKFAFSKAQLDAATRGYKDINMLGMRLLRPGGILCTFSCSGLVSEDLFQKVVFGASVDVHRDVRILQRLAQGPDHPVLLSFPEGAYLNGLICRVE